MIKLIYGAKGTGKTKRIIDDANGSDAKVTGFVVYLSDTSRYRREIKNTIRFIDTTDWQIKGEDMLVGFLGGLIAGNFDIQEIYMDGAVRMIGTTLAEMESFMKRLDAISREHNIDFVLTISSDLVNMPKFFLPYIDNAR